MYVNSHEPISLMIFSLRSCAIVIQMVLSVSPLDSASLYLSCYFCSYSIWDAATSSLWMKQGRMTHYQPTDRCADWPQILCILIRIDGAWTKSTCKQPDHFPYGAIMNLYCDAESASFGYWVMKVWNAICLIGLHLLSWTVTSKLAHHARVLKHPFRLWWNSDEKSSVGDENSCICKLLARN